jgi:transaldolase
MTRLHDLFDEHGQSPWIDNLTRTGIRSGHLQQLVDAGVRGVTSNPSIFQKAIAGSADYDDQFKALLASHTVEEAYWELVFQDITDALDVLAPLHDASGGTDGFVSLEVAPALANDTAGTVEATRSFAQRITRPNLMVKIPGTADGVPAVRAMIAEGISINTTLIFGIPRYADVIEAYLAGLESREGDLSGVNGVASFFISRVDTEVDRRLEAIGTKDALGLRGRAAVAQAQLAYDLFRQRFTGARWEALAARGARVQRPLWASTSTKNPAYPDLLYVDTLIGPDTVNTMPDTTIDAFLDHGTAARTVDVGLDVAKATIDRIEALGIEMRDVAETLEAEGVAAFVKSFDELVQSLQDKANGWGAGAGRQDNGWGAGAGRQDNGAVQ